MPPKLLSFNLGDFAFDGMNEWGGGGGAAPQSPAPAAAPAPPASIFAQPRRPVARSNNGGLGGPAAPPATGPSAVNGWWNQGAGGREGFTPPAGNTPAYNEMLQAQNFANNIGLANTFIDGAKTVGSIGLGIWRMWQAQEMNAIAKTAYQENYNSTAQAYNTRMEDQYRAARGNSPETDAAIEARKIKPSTIK